MLPRSRDPVECGTLQCPVHCSTHRPGSQQAARPCFGRKPRTVLLDRPIRGRIFRDDRRHAQNWGHIWSAMR
jgi:hypothetical protein